MRESLAKATLSFIQLVKTGAIQKNIILVACTLLCNAQSDTQIHTGND